MEKSVVALFFGKGKRRNRRLLCVKAERVISDIMEAF